MPRHFSIPRRLRSMRVKVAVLITACVGVLAMVAVVQSSREFKAASADAGKAEALKLARSFGADFARDGQDDPSLLRQQVRALQTVNPQILNVSVYGKRNGKVSRIATTSKMDLNAPVDAEHARALRTKRPRYHVVQGQRQAELTYPVRVPGRDLATVAISYDLSALDAVLAKRERRLLLAAGGATLLIALLATLFAAYDLLRPIRRLKLATQRIKQGELGTRLRWSRADELGELARGFDDMAATLEEHRRLEALALADPLTGLLNHRAFQERFYAELSRARREGYPVALAAIGIDHFKRINDSAGHAVGDKALRLVANTIMRTIRPSDICGRVGADEFMVALHGMDACESRPVVERLRDRIASAKLDSTSHTVTVSAGIAEFPHHATEQNELMRLAGGAMYWSKSHGRNRSSVYSPDTDEALSAEEDADRIRRDSLIRTVHALARAVDAKDGYTHLHSKRVAFYATTLGSSLGLAQERIEMIRSAGILHDVGKIGIPDAILLKPGKLTSEEFAIMRRHSELGRDIIAGAGMTEIARWILHLHERYDGHGYPDKLAGEAIPVESRVLHAADALEAMTSPRVYRPALELEQALAELRDNAGTQFDASIAQRLIRLVRTNRIRIDDDTAVFAFDEHAASQPATGVDPLPSAEKAAH